MGWTRGALRASGTSARQQARRARAASPTHGRWRLICQRPDFCALTNAQQHLRLAWIENSTFSPALASLSLPPPRPWVGRAANSNGASACQRWGALRAPSPDRG
eukprot:6472146-Pyramimonas_sp.AAC.1